MSEMTIRSYNVNTTTTDNSRPAWRSGH